MTRMKLERYYRRMEAKEIWTDYVWEPVIDDAAARTIYPPDDGDAILARSNARPEHDERLSAPGDEDYDALRGFFPGFLTKDEIARGIEPRYCRIPVENRSGRLYVGIGGAVFNIGMRSEWADAASRTGTRLGTLIARSCNDDETRGRVTAWLANDRPNGA